MLGFIGKPFRLAVEGFWSGFWAPLRALKLIVTSPPLLSLVAIPLAMNVALYIVFFHYGAGYLDGLVAQAMAHLTASLPTWLVGISGWILKILSWLLLALTALFTFTFVGSIVGAPFNDLLSKATMRRHLKALHAHFPTPEIRNPLPTMIWLECKRTTVLVIGAVVAMLVALVPLLQLVGLAIGAVVVSFEYFGYPISHRSDSLRPVALFTLRHPAVSLGFGTFLILLMALPFASLISIPLAVVGSTMLYAEHAALSYDISRK